jgi:23S rRNA (pseudouridine1915-N3)-methyltransferase
MKIILMQTGKTTGRFIPEAVDDYAARIRKYTAFETITVPDLKNTKNMPVSLQREKEGSAILDKMNADDYVILLDEKGKEFTTREFAGRLSKIFMLNKKRVVFVIGGPWGFSEAVRARADLFLSLSKLTFSHQVVRLLFAEQLYRVLSLIKGDPYHHE